MKITQKLYVKNRKEWRSWLKKNFDKKKEIWLVYPKNSSNKPRILYNDAVEEALCFGWIDSTRKSLDKNNSVQRYSPRNSRSSFSQQNKERLKWLLKNNLVHKSVKEKAQTVIKEKFKFPEDIINILKKDKDIWNNYKNFSETYKRIRIAYIEVARLNPDEFNKRLNNFINKTRNDKKIGYGGIDKYY